MKLGVRYGGARKSSSGQVPVLAALLFLLLVPTTIILAENATLNVTGDTLLNFSADNSTNTTAGGNFSIADISNHTSELNGTTNPTLLKNETNTTATGNQTPGVSENGTIGPILEIGLDLPDRIDRNTVFNSSATIKNTGDQEATGVGIEWILPRGFSIIEGSGGHYCDIPSGAACLSELIVAASLSSETGEHEIKVLVRYDE
jgi:hypothetical protein